MKTLWILLSIFVLKSSGAPSSKCDKPSSTRVSGRLSPRGPFCPGDLIFEDNFDDLDLFRWQHENTLGGSDTGEFQWYNNNRTNSFTKDGKLHIRPTLLSDQFGEDFLTTGTLNLHGGSPSDGCTNPAFRGCERTGTKEYILNPIKSARLRTAFSFRFRYGRVEISAKVPSGDWLLPSLWLLPAENAYGSWPASGEINLLELRSNKNLVRNGVNIGAQQATSTLHFGPYPEIDSWNRTHYKKQYGEGYNKEFKKYQLEWTPDYLAFSIDGEEFGRVTPKENGFWELGNFAKDAPGIDNPWKSANKMAPFDQEFYILMNLGVGGLKHFPDDASNPDAKPWKNNSPSAMKEFYDQKDKWLKTWDLDKNGGEDASLLIDYVKVWAI